LRRLPGLAEAAAVAVPRLREPFAPSAAPAAFPREDPGHVPLARRLADLARARDHRDDADGGHEPHDSHSELALWHGAAPRDRRLRHGVLVAERAPAVPDRHAEDRPVVHPRRRDRPGRRGDRRDDHPHGAQPEARRRGGRRRVRGAARISAPSRLRLRAGASVRRSGRCRYVRRDAGGGGGRHRQVPVAVCLGARGLTARSAPAARANGDGLAGPSAGAIVRPTNTRLKRYRMKRSTGLAFRTTALASGMLAGTAAFACETPAMVEVPDGATATTEQMVQAREAVTAYVAAMEEYLV